jgi:glyoxylase-like metal-dependent hydrolase (beta-lactamase superfamily II)
LREHLAAAGRPLSDIRAVLLTHARPDHTGLVTALHQAGADVWIHQQDVLTLTDGPRSAMRHAKPERALVPYVLRRPAASGTPLHMALQGGFTASSFSQARSFDGDWTFDSLPGHPGR